MFLAAHVSDALTLQRSWLVEMKHWHLVCGNAALTRCRGRCIIMNRGIGQDGHLFDSQLSQVLCQTASNAAEGS